MHFGFATKGDYCYAKTEKRCLRDHLLNPFCFFIIWIYLTALYFPLIFTPCLLKQSAHQPTDDAMSHSICIILLQPCCWSVFVGVIVIDLPVEIQRIRKMLKYLKLRFHNDRRKKAINRRLSWSAISLIEIIMLVAWCSAMKSRK